MSAGTGAIYRITIFWRSTGAVNRRGSEAIVSLNVNGDSQNDRLEWRDLDRPRECVWDSHGAIGETCFRLAKACSERLDGTNLYLRLGAGICLRSRSR
jgi:hypothetical protein